MDFVFQYAGGDCDFMQSGGEVFAEIYAEIMDAFKRCQIMAPFFVSGACIFFREVLKIKEKAGIL